MARRETFLVLKKVKTRDGTREFDAKKTGQITLAGL